ncbi:hypothetical protein [uncultured Thalassospira sp.]|jgi:hypothetical protein|uniref:hypothetical protein n=1 Tax=uncultured Thalassospira sp. TaxID=404382 RepID=UPI0030DA02C4|tara:strand:- start:4882 stop:5052 length:171 start_codon:yes stop_codon:yes gene_type:complete
MRLTSIRDGQPQVCAQRHHDNKPVSVLFLPFSGWLAETSRSHSGGTALGDTYCELL